MGYNIKAFEEKDWPSITHSQFNEVARHIDIYPRLVLAGRRRIGKSYMISQLAQQLWRSKESVFYIGLPHLISGDITDALLREVLEQLYAFDDSIPKPTQGIQLTFYPHLLTLYSRIYAI
jgi:hypothetical protein